MDCADYDSGQFSGLKSSASESSILTFVTACELVDSELVDSELVAECSSEDDEKVNVQHNYDTLPKECKKYWKQRYSLFSRFDEGVYMSSELWFSVTPEALAVFVARFASCCLPNAASSTVLEVFSGGGGNTIQFARVFGHCVGVDYSRVNIYCAAHNAEVYGVSDKVSFVNANWRKYAKPCAVVESLKSEFPHISFVFASPPWGGPGYRHQKVFNLQQLKPLAIVPLLRSLHLFSDHIILLLPLNSNISQLSRATKIVFGPKAMVRVLKSRINGREKGLVCLWGNHFMTDDMRRSKPNPPSGNPGTTCQFEDAAI